MSVEEESSSASATTTLPKPSVFSVSALLAADPKKKTPVSNMRTRDEREQDEITPAELAAARPLLYSSALTLDLLAKSRDYFKMNMANAAQVS